MPNLALFDFDNTITKNDNFTAFVYYAVPKHRIVAGLLLLWPMILAYKFKAISASRLRKSIAFVGFRGRTKDEVQKLGIAYAREYLQSVIHPYARERLDWHQAQGDTIAVVSASLDVYLRDWCHDQGFDLICTELEVKNSQLSGRYINGDCTGPEKAKRICQHYNLADYDEIYAYGDSKEDAEMLALANKKFFCWKPA